MEKFKVPLFGKNIKNFFLKTIENKEDKELSYINQILITEEMSCKDFGLPEPNKFEMKKPDECDV